MHTPVAWNSLFAKITEDIVGKIHEHDDIEEDILEQLLYGVYNNTSKYCYEFIRYSQPILGLPEISKLDLEEIAIIPQYKPSARPSTSGLSRHTRFQKPPRPQLMTCG